jgi:chromosome partitioning protein
MQTLVIASRKGGAGKTTLSRSIGVMAEISGAGPVALIDTDEQAGLAMWWNARESQTPVFASVTIDNLKSHLEGLRNAGIKLVVIDTPPGLNSESTATLEAVLPNADLVLIPVRPSPDDLRSVGATIQLVEQAKKRMVFVINGAANRASISSKVAIELSQHGTVAPVMLFQRTVFATSGIDGRTAQEVEPNGNSAKEVAELWEYVSAQLRK